MAPIDLLFDRLTNAGFEIQRNVDLAPYHLELVAKKDTGKNPLARLIWFVVVSLADSADISYLREYNMKVTEFVLDTLGSHKGRGAGAGVLSMPILMCKSPTDEAVEWVESNISPKHWAAFEFPVLVSLSSGQTSYCKKTPIWGAVYYRGFRKFVQEFVANRS